MPPSGNTRAKTRKATRKSTKRSPFKKKTTKPKTTTTHQDISSPSNSSSVVCNDVAKIEDFEDAGAAADDDVSTSACSTPKGQRFRIPEIVTCPPAPKKQRMIPTCLFRRSPIAFFAPPDLELFFYVANGGISV